MGRRSLLDLFYRLGTRGYDRMYRNGAPWESGPRAELVELVESGRIDAGVLAPGRAIDLGCGAGADVIYLAQHGFQVTGVDFSAVAIDRARQAAAGEESDTPPRFVVADLLTLPNVTVPGPFDLLFDGGSLDDFPPRHRPRLADRITELARPGALFVMWCFYAADRDLPRLSFTGPSRWGAPAIEPGEERALFADAWDIEQFHPSFAQPQSACFLMTRR